jgi:Flp pilus assembly pilin Flp
MKMLIRLKKAQSTLEYAILIGVVIGALLSMQSYLKRSLQGKLKDVGDQIGTQYSPGGTKMVSTSETSDATHTETYASGAGQKLQVNDVVGSTSSNETRKMKALSRETWPSQWQ